METSMMTLITMDKKKKKMNVIEVVNQTVKSLREGDKTPSSKGSRTGSEYDVIYMPRWELINDIADLKRSIKYQLTEAEKPNTPEKEKDGRYLMAGRLRRHLEIAEDELKKRDKKS